MKKCAKDLIRHFSKEETQWPMGVWKYLKNHQSPGKCKSKPQLDISSLVLEWIS
jgi:hypothetical protein